MAFEGYVDETGPTAISGWVFDDRWPNRSLTVEILQGDRVVATIRADAFRPDLLAFEKGDGRHAFSYSQPTGDVPLAARVMGQRWTLQPGGPPPVVGPHRFVRNLPHSYEFGWPNVDGAFTDAAAVAVRPGIVERLMTAYHKAIKADPNKPFAEDDVWSQLSDSCHADLMPLLKKKNVRGLSQYLADAHNKGITHGISQGGTTTANFRSNADARRLAVGQFHNYLVSLAEFVGALDVESPEQHGRWAENVHEPVDDLVRAISAAIGVDLVPPPVMGSLLGLKVAGGLLSGRDLLGAYAALRLKQLGGSSVCEIGAGFGPAAYYAHRLGFKSYTIIDLPVVNLLHGFYLLQSLPTADIRLYGEPPGGEISIQPTWTFDAMPPFDLLLNCDSFPEMNRRYSVGYLTTARRLVRRAILSINQEAHAPQNETETQPAVRELVRHVGGYRTVSRFRHWLRPDYVDEVFAAEDIEPRRHGGTEKKN